MYPKVNQNIVIDIIRHDQSCRSIIADVGEKEILIAFPLDKNSMGLLTEGTHISVMFMTGDNQYKFQAEIIGKTKDKIALYRIQKPLEKDIIKVQRRDNFRVSSNLRLTLNEKEMNTINISVGGVLVSCMKDLQLQEGEVVSGTLLVPNKQKTEPEQIPFKAKIKRINVIKDDDRKNVAMEFTDIDQRDQMKIVQYCFEKQRQMRLKTR